MRIFGAIFILVGFFFSLSIIGAVIGIPLILIGLIMVIFGGHRRTIITNVVQVSNQAPPPPRFDSEGDDDRAFRKSPQTLRTDFEPRLIPPVQQRLAARMPTPEFEPEYDEETEFSDLRSEITKVSKQILALAQQDGYEIRVRPDCVILMKQGLEDVLKSNSAIWQFAREQRTILPPSLVRLTGSTC